MFIYLCLYVYVYINVLNLFINSQDHLARLVGTHPH